MRYDASNAMMVKNVRSSYPRVYEYYILNTTVTLLMLEYYNIQHICCVSLQQKARGNSSYYYYSSRVLSRGENLKMPKPPCYVCSTGSVNLRSRYYGEFMYGALYITRIMLSIFPYEVPGNYLSRAPFCSENYSNGTFASRGKKWLYKNYPKGGSYGNKILYKNLKFFDNFRAKILPSKIS